MDFARLKEKLRSVPLELFKKLMVFFLALWSNLFPPAKGPKGRYGALYSRVWDDEPSPYTTKRRLIFFGLIGAAVLVFCFVIAIIIINARHRIPVLSDIMASLTIPSEELFFPAEPDFLPGFLPEREPRRFWSLDDLRLYWRAPGNSDWWMEEIITTVDSLMEGVP